MLKDRADAGKKLAGRLQRYKGADAIVLALPRGGVVTGYALARALALPLDIVVVRKIGHPAHPEYAIGAIDKDGMRLMNEAEAANVDAAWLAAETEVQRAEAKRRYELYRGGRPAPSFKGRTVLLVDDGIATGFTMRLAVRAVRAQKPRKVVIAVPVAPPEAVAQLREEGADEVVLLEPPEEFMGAVGAHYLRFDQTTDDEVIELLTLMAENRGMKL